MDFEQAKSDVMTWVQGFVEQPNPGLRGWPPCPYARRARLDGEFEIRPGVIDPYTDLMHAELNGKTVVAYVYDPAMITADQFNTQIERVNRGFLVARDLLALADHPDCVEEVQGVRMNQGQWAIAFLQPLGKLNDFARLVAARGYYDGWPEDYLVDLFQFREDPRR